MISLAARDKARAAHQAQSAKGSFVHRSLLIAALVAMTSAATIAAQEPTAPAQQPTAPAQQPAEPELVRRDIGAWSVICAVSGSPCAMEQIGKTAAGEDAILMQVEKLPEPTTAEGRRIVAVANILTPRNAFLQPGVTLRVDGGQARTYPYFACQNNGCLVQIAMDEPMVAQMRRGARLAVTLAVFQPKGPASGDAFISLSGFTRAFGEL